MKNFIKITLILTSIAVFFACQKSEQTSNIATNTSNKQIYKAVGIVKNIDAENGKITIDHEDIPGYMSAMQMTESVGDRLILQSLKTGDKINFELERTGANLLITKITKIGEVAMLNSAEIYKINCAECHGDKGEGAKKGIPLVSGHALHHTETEHIKQVTDGEGKKMPAFRDKLTTEEIKAVVDFVRNDLQKTTKRDDSRKHQH